MPGCEGVPGSDGSGGLLSSEKRRPPRGGGGVGALSIIGDLVECCEVALGGLRRVEDFRRTGEAILPSVIMFEEEEKADAEVEGTMMVRLTTALNGSTPSRMTRARGLTLASIGFALIEGFRDDGEGEGAASGELAPSCLGTSEEPARVVEFDRCNRKPLIISSSSPKDFPARRNASTASSSSWVVANTGGEALSEVAPRIRWKRGDWLCD